MKLIATVIFLSITTLTAVAQAPAQALKGATYGAGTSAEGAISISEMTNKMNTGAFTGKVSGTVTEVCQEMGCWMKLDKANGETLLVKFKDYGFFMPKDIVGREVVVEGEAVNKEVSVKQLRHYAKDAGKSKEEIEKINAPKKETQFIAKGVLVL